jgi:hypothetical protein
MAAGWCGEPSQASISMTMWVQLTIIAVVPIVIVLYLFVVRWLTADESTTKPW